MMTPNNQQREERGINCGGWKACPHCGSLAIRSSYIRDGQKVGCSNCSASVHAFQPDALSKATDLWNTRADTPAAHPEEWVRKEDAASVAECHFDDRSRMQIANFDWSDGYQDACRGVAKALRALAPTPPTTGDKVRERAWMMAYAALRSAQHALDIISRQSTDSAVITLAEEESERIEQAMAAIDPDTPPTTEATIPDGMVRWEGGDSAPEDAPEMVEVMTRSGHVSVMRKSAVHWRYGTFIHELGEPMPPACDIIAYTPLATTKAPTLPVAEGVEHRFGSPPEPVANPNEAWCERYADWYYQGKS